MISRLGYAFLGERRGEEKIEREGKEDLSLYNQIISDATVAHLRSDDVGWMNGTSIKQIPK
jgi:hypothetical protein